MNMNKLMIAGSLKLRFRARYAFFFTLMLIALGLFGTQPASAAVLDTLHYNGHTYYLISENTYEGAAAESLALGGYLTTINDQGEQDFLWNSWKNSLGTGEGLWIGLEKSHHGSIFVWMIGERGMVGVNTPGSAEISAPEVAALVLLGSGLTGLILRRRRRAAAAGNGDAEVEASQESNSTPAG